MQETLTSLLNLGAYSLTQRRRVVNLGLALLGWGMLIIHFGIEAAEGEATFLLSLLLIVALGPMIVLLLRQGKLPLASRLYIAGTFSSIFMPVLVEQHSMDGIDLLMIFLSLAFIGLFARPREVFWTLVAISFAWLLALAYKVDVVSMTEILPDEANLGETLLLIALSWIFGAISWYNASSLESALHSESQMSGRYRLSEASAQVTQRIFTRLDLEMLLSDTVELIRASFDDVYHAQVFLINPATQQAILRASTGEVGRMLIQAKHQLGVGSQSVIGQVTARGVPVLAGDTSQNSVHRVNELLPETRAELALPLRSRDGIIGALDVQSTRPDAFAQADIDALQALADQIALAVDNARLFEEAQDEAARARALAQATQITSYINLDFSTGMQELLRTIAAPGSYDRWWVGLVTPDRQHLQRIAIHKEDLSKTSHPELMPLTLTQNSIVEAYRSRNPVIVNEFADHPLLGQVPAETRRVFGKHLAMPILDSTKMRVIGVLVVGRDIDAADLTERDLELVTSLTNQVAIALENQRLFERVNENQRTLQTILSAMPTGVLVLNPQLEVMLANDQAQQLVGQGLMPGAALEGNTYPFYYTGTDTPYPLDQLPINQVLQSGQVASIENLTVRHPNGFTIDLIARAAPILDDRGQVTAVIVNFQDVAELRDLERALQDSLEEARKLYEVSRALSHAGDMNALAEAVIKQVLPLKPDRIYMAVKQEEIEAPQMVAAYPPDVDVVNLPNVLLMPPQDFETANFTFATKDLLRIPGITKSDQEVLEAQGIRSMIVLPLEMRHEILGAIIATYTTDRDFSVPERRYLITLADQAAVALDAITSYQHTEEALTATSNLYNASRAIAEKQDVNQVMDVVVEQLNLLQPDRIDVVLFRTAEEVANPQYAMTWARDEAAGMAPVLPLFEQNSSFRVTGGEDYLLPDVGAAAAEDNPLALLLKDAQAPYQSVVSLPFRTSGQTLGRLAVGFKRANAIGQDDYHFVQMLADSVSYVIENDLLFRQTQDSLEETGILYQAIRAFANADSKEDIIQAIIDYAADPAVDKALLCLLLSPSWKSPNAMMEVAVSWVRTEAIALTGMRFTEAQFPSWEQISSEELIWVDDVMLDPMLDDTARMGYRALDIAAMTIIPMQAAGRPIGAIVLGSSAPRVHTEREIRIYQSLSDQAAITLQNIQLSEAAERRARQLETSSRVSQAANAILSLDELLPEIVELIKDAFHYDQVQIFLISEDGKEAQLRASTGEAGRQLLDIRHSLPVGSHSVIGRVTETGLAAVALDTADARVVHKPNPYLPNTRSEMAVPLIARGKVVGALDVQSNQPGAFTDEDIRNMSTLAEQLAIAIDNASLFELSERNLEESQVLYRTIRALADVERTEDIINAVVQHAIPAGIDKVMLCLLLSSSWDEPDAMIEVSTSWVSGESIDLTGMRFTAEQFPSWAQLSSDEVLWVNDVMNEPEMDEAARIGYRALNIVSFVIIPLATPSGPLGAIMLTSSEPQQHQEREIRVYQALADQAAITLESNRLFQQAERRARQLATSATVSQVANAILNLDELLPQMVDLIKENFRYDHVQIFMLSANGQEALLRASTGEAGRQLLEIGHHLAVGSMSVIGQVTATGRPSIALDTADSRAVHKPNPYLPSTRSEMAVPLLAKGKVLGALDVQSNKPGAFSDEDVRILSSLANQLANAIENARLFELSERRGEEMRFLFSVVAEATASENLAFVLNRVSTMLLEQTKADLVVPYMWIEEEQALQPQAFAAFNRSYDEAELYPVELNAQDLIARVGRNREPLLLLDLSSVEDYHPRLSGMQAGVYAPLISGDSLVGLFAVESRNRGHFNDDVVSLLQALTGSLAAVIQNTRLLEDLRAANERLREVDKLKTNFLAAMSHELRTPLNSIIGFSRVILKGIDGPITDMQQQDLQTIHDSGRHLLGLVNDILDQAKIEAGKMELAREYFDLETVVRGVMDSAKGLTKDKPVRLDTQVESGLPKAFGDEFRTRQVLFNLISNAAKFTETGSIIMSAHTVMDGEQEFIQVSVTDTGIGIREQDFPKLFESFQQVDNSTTRAAEGTGLGLPLAKSLIELQGGRIWVESEPGVGSTFSITIPIDPPPVDETPPGTSELNAASAVSASNGRGRVTLQQPRFVLVIEEDVDMLNLYRRYLSNAGYNVVGATQLQGIEDTLMQRQFVGVILDVNVEDGQGWAFLEEKAASLPIMVVSLNDDTERSQRLQARAHLTKPFMQDDLLEALEKMVPETS